MCRACTPLTASPPHEPCLAGKPQRAWAPIARSSADRLLWLKGAHWASLLQLVAAATGAMALLASPHAASSHSTTVVGALRVFRGGARAATALAAGRRSPLTAPGAAPASLLQGGRHVCASRHDVLPGRAAVGTAASGQVFQH